MRKTVMPTTITALFTTLDTHAALCLIIKLNCWVACLYRLSAFPKVAKSLKIQLCPMLQLHLHLQYDFLVFHNTMYFDVFMCCIDTKLFRKIR